ncbi:dihydrofolate reductase family protein [Rhizobium sp. Root1220]|uniref:dihydrofolate reductase family protein n=1 Tax=Rhizobium sp. Root1220 TaxID=1736432 RepID=UPI0006FDF8A4|nr:dihydrofolate reductase family protein [Rhizobium sp. Root1220]KQV81987.1 hypothetical protein ASC90_24015 [Rhizobium sp. Root1220]
MRKLRIFLSISLDGYFADENGDLNWAHSDDTEFNAFVAGNASAGGELVMGRVTYDLMAAYWPTAVAKQNDPVVAEGMNSLPKLVFSRKTREATWANTRLTNDDPVDTIRVLKREQGRDLVVLGSGSIVRQLATAGLVDGFQFVVVPIVLGRGQSVFADIGETIRLQLTGNRAFGNGNLVLTYIPAS